MSCQNPLDSFLKLLCSLFSQRGIKVAVKQAIMCFLGRDCLTSSFSPTDSIADACVVHIVTK